MPVRHGPFKKVSDKNCFAFNTLTLASRKQFIALRKHYFQCPLADQNLIPAKQRDFSTFYTKASRQQSSCTSSKTLNNTFNCRFEEAILDDVSTLVLMPRAIKIQSRLNKATFSYFTQKNQTSIILIYFFQKYK